MAVRQMTKLKAQFLTYNVLYFSGQLSTDTIVVWTRKMRPPQCCGDCDPEIIRINAVLKRFAPVWKATLLHEMCHLATLDEKAEHGPQWQAQMRRLLKMGAFDGLL